MTEHRAEIAWHRGGAAFDKKYDRNHTWTFDGGVQVPASAAPHLFGDATRVDPEEAFVASISSCHMMWFLYLAAERGLVVDRYTDAAVGTMVHERGHHTWVARVELHPRIEWAGDAPGAEVVAQLHEQSHRRCFIANSVKSEIVIVTEG